MAASSIGMHWTPLFPSHTSWKWCIQVSGCIEPISTPPSLENMHPSSTQCQYCRKPTPTSLDWWKYFPFWALLLLSLTIKLNVITIAVSLRQVLNPLPPQPYLKKHISKLVTVHISCAYSQHIVTYCAYRWVISPCFPAHSLKWKRAWKPILPLAHHCFSFSPRLLN